MSTLLITHPACLDHLTPAGHPERPDRLRAIDRALEHERFQILARAEALLDSVWDYRATPITRTVDMHIAKLRKKIEPDPREPRYLLTIHGLGYKLAEA